MKKLTNANNMSMSILISHDFFPLMGGAHLWLYEVYKRWPLKVSAIVHDYSNDIKYGKLQAEFDKLDHNSLDIIRKNLSIDNLSIVNIACLKTYYQTIKTIDKIAKCNPVCIHSLRAFPEGFAALLYKILNFKTTRLCTYAHGEEVLIARSSRQLTLMAKMVYKFSDIVIANSHSTKKLVQSFEPTAKIEVVHPGVDISQYNVSESEKEKQRLKWNIGDGEILLFSVSRMEKRKNQSMVIKALHTLKSQGINNIKAVFAGNGEERNNLEAMVKEYSLENEVKFTGYLSDEEKIVAMAAADIHIMPSIEFENTTEGFGIVFLEAAASGTPSIAGNAGGQPEAVIDGKTGFVVDGSSPEKVTDAIKKLSLDENLRKKMGKAGQVWAELNDWGNVSIKIQHIVNQLQLKTI